MLLFIDNRIEQYSSIHSNFNTSHVTVYPWCNKAINKYEKYFNTSHVTVYRFSSISIPSRNPDFNTSHVTVYLRELMELPDRIHISIHLMLLFIKNLSRASRTIGKFQYISCYCLSITHYQTGIAITIFQYISCYCLSHSSQQVLCMVTNFNTSHVTVYQLGQFTAY